MMGYWGYNPPTVSRDGPVATKVKRAAAAVGSCANTEKASKKKVKTGEHVAVPPPKRQKEPAARSEDSDDGRAEKRKPTQGHDDSDTPSDDDAVDRGVGAKAGGGVEGVKLGKKQQGTGKDKKKPSHFLYYGRFLAIPISVDDQPERLFLGKIIDENTESKQFLVFFKEDGEKLWYDEDEVAMFCFQFEVVVILFSRLSPSTFWKKRGLIR